MIPVTETPWVHIFLQVPATRSLFQVSLEPKVINLHIRWVRGQWHWLVMLHVAPVDHGSIG